MGFSKAKWELFLQTLAQKNWQNDIIVGLKNTLLIAICGLLIGIVIGVIVGIIRVAPKYKWYAKVADKICLVYVTVFRGTPTVVQLLLGYYVVGSLCVTIFGSFIPALYAAIIILGLNSGAYLSEMVRGGINSVDKGQLEASRALGLSYRTSMIKVVIPQAIKNIIPSIGNEFIALVKETCVVGFISVANLTKVFTEMSGNNFLFMFTYLLMALIYIAIIVIASIVVKFIERMLARSDRRN